MCAVPIRPASAGKCGSVELAAPFVSCTLNTYVSMFQNILAKSPALNWLTPSQSHTHRCALCLLKVTHTGQCTVSQGHNTIKGCGQDWCQHPSVVVLWMGSGECSSWQRTNKYRLSLRGWLHSAVHFPSLLSASYNQISKITTANSNLNIQLEVWKFNLHLTSLTGSVCINWITQKMRRKCYYNNDSLLQYLAEKKDRFTMICLSLVLEIEIKWMKFPYNKQ